MTSVKDDEDFWYSTERRSFSFDNVEVDQLFGVSKSDTERLWAGLSNTTSSSSDGESRQNEDTQYSKPLSSVISDETISRILTADRPQLGVAQSADVQPNVTLQKILLGQPHTLEAYKSLASKVDLLDAATLTGDGNAILTVGIREAMSKIILFLTKTLKRSLLQRLLTVRPDAANVYVHYLSIRLQINEVVDILTMLGQSLDSAMKHLHIIVRNTRDPSRLQQKLESCYKTQFSTLSRSKEASFLRRFIELLEWQGKVKNSAGETERLEHHSSVLECLRFACNNYWNSAEGLPTSPTTLCRQHDISPRQYQKNALLVRASVGAWDDVDRLFPAKGWLKNKRLQTNLPIDDILTILHDHHAPASLLEKYLKHVDDAERRLDLAKRFHCHRIVTDMLASQGDRAALLEYKGKLQSQSEEYFYVEGALRSSTARWKS